VASCSNDVAEAGCGAASEGGAGSSFEKVSACPGVAATRATNAARALVLPVVDSEDEAAVKEVGAAGSSRNSGGVPAFDAGADFAQRPEVDVAPAAEVGACEGAAPEEIDAPAADDVVAAEVAAGADEAPDVGDVVGADKLPGFAGRGGAFAAGGGEAGGAGRAGGTVGMADLGAVLGDVAVRADVAEVADVLEAGVPDAAGDPEGRLASVEVVEAGLVASDTRAVGMLVALEPVVRVGVAPVAEDVAVAPVFADGASARGAGPACAVCEDVDFDAIVDLLEAGGVVSDATAVGDLRAAAAAADDPDPGAETVVEVVEEAAGEAEDGVAGAADRVGGIGASPDPRSAASSIGDAQVPEYALSVDVDDAHDPDDVEAAPELPETAESDACVAGMVGIPNPAGDLCVSAAVEALADALGDRAGAGAPDPMPWVAAGVPGTGVAACDDAGGAAAGACLAAVALEEIGVGAVASV
jgi:hypothetical protein